jgi:prefoldin beta subunit
MNKEIEEKVSELSQIEQNLQGFLQQRQKFQSELLEIESALKELKETDESYKIIGNVMVRIKQDELISELKSKQEVLNIRVKSIEKQEEKIKENQKALQKEVLEQIENEEKKKK